MQVVARDGSVGLAGVESCGSVWVCPVCAGAICAERSREVVSLVESWGRDKVVMVTLTVRHEHGNLLSRELLGLSRAWHSVWSGRAVADMRERWGIGPWVRAVEATWGRNGWHAHQHLLLCLRSTIDAAGREDMRRALTERWQHGVGAALGEEAVPDADRGVSVEMVRDSAYLTKLGLELSGARKVARSSGGMHPFDIAESAARGEARGVMLWREYWKATRGRRQLTWSREANARRRTDAQIADDVPEGEKVVELTAKQWRELTASPGALPDLLQTVRDSMSIEYPVG